MKKVSLGKLVGGILKAAPAPLLQWQPESKPYPRVLDMNTEAVKGRGGLYAVWHLGVRPQWLRVGATADLGGSFAMLKTAPWIVLHENNAGVFAAFAFAPPAAAAGMARFLADTLRPVFQMENSVGDLSLDVAPVAAPLPPGTRP
jgi:hypothetical protein